MAYSPTVQYVRSGHRDYNPPAIDTKLDESAALMEGGVKTITDAISQKYQDTEDFYDIQKKEAESLNKALDGLDGADYEYTMKKVVEKRDQLAELFKGKKLKDYNSPEFQKQLFDIKKDLSLVANGSGSSRAGLTKAKDLVKTIPHYKQDEAYKWIASQTQLPPDQREQDPVGFLMSDPQFRNPADFIIGWAKKQGEETSPLIKRTGNVVYDSEMINYRGVYDNAGGFVLSDDAVDQMFQEQPWFFTSMQNMARDPEQNKMIVGQGHTTLEKQDVVDFTKGYIQQIEALKNRENAKGSTFKMESTRPTSGEIKNEEEDKAIADFQKRLLSGDTNPAQEFITAAGDKGWSGFDVVKDQSGRVVQIKTKARQYNARKKKIETVEDVLTVNPLDIADVSKVYKFLRENAQKSDNVNTEGVPSGSTIQSKKKSIAGF